MEALIAYFSILVLLLTYAILQLSISLIFWIVKKPNHNELIFRKYFPYYIICLVGIATWVIIITELMFASTIYFSLVYVMALLIWRSKLKAGQKIKKNKNIEVKPNQYQLP